MGGNGCPNRTTANSTLPGINPIAGTYNADDEEISSETYDANGNTTLAANGNSYTYDSENHMTSATGNGKTITMAYDAFGNRVAKTVNSGTTSVTTHYLVEDDVNPAGVEASMLSSSARASAGSSTGVLPVRTTWRGPRTEAAGITGTTWRVTNPTKTENNTLDN